MGFTQADVDALKEAIALGATEVEYNGKKVKYASLDSLRARLEIVEAEVNPPSKRRVTRVMGVYYKNT